jgi:hypothetical protein
MREEREQFHQTTLKCAIAAGPPTPTQSSIAVLKFCNSKCFFGLDSSIPSSMPSDFLAVEFICLILALGRIHISSSIGCRRLDKLDRKQSNVTYVERRKMSLDNVRRQSDARCAPIWGSCPVLTSSRDSATSPLGRQN